jgi:hypothetical protein
MNKTVITFFLLCIGLIMLIIYMQTFNTKDGEFSGGLFSLYSGIILLYFSWKKKETSMGGLRFRGLATGIVCALVGLYLILKYFSPR